jgi:hypothetical protein
MSEILVHRFERYFKHPDDGHGVLTRCWRCCRRSRGSGSGPPGQARGQAPMEWEFAEEVERQVDDTVLVFVCLDDTPLPERHNERLAIPAGIAVHEVGQRILHALGAEMLRPPPPPRIG